MSSIVDIWNKILDISKNIPSIHTNDIIDVAIVAFLIYQLIKIIRNTRAWTLFKGIGIILFIAAVAYFLQLNTVLWIFSKTISVGIIAVIVIFQPELRTALEKIGTGNVLASMFRMDEVKKQEKIAVKTIDEIVTGIKHLSEEKTGAIIVIEQDVKLGEFETTGIRLDSIVSSEILVNIFEKNTPLHDGSVMIRDNRITYATCYLPLTNNPNISKKYGTRHRAAIGITEISDAVVIVVSEERGSISLCKDGELKYNVDKEHIRNEIILSLKSNRNKKLMKGISG